MAPAAFYYLYAMGIQLTAQETGEAIASLKKYFASELDTSLGDLPAKLLLGYVLKEVGPLAYNRGVHDAEEFFRKRLEDLPATCFEPAFTYWQTKKKSRGENIAEGQSGFELA